jgi:hypothetical protein
MRPVPQDATDLLQGTLESPSNGPGQSSMRITNALPFGVYVYELTSTGDFAGLPNNGTAATPGSPGALLTPGNSLNFGQYNQGAYFLVTAAYSGGFVCVFQANESDSNLEINTELLLEPNAIGPIPQPNATQVIPPDSQCVVVGCGVAGPNNAVAVVREQYWRRLPDSYTIAPGQSKTISFTTVEGMQSTSVQPGDHCRADRHQCLGGMGAGVGLGIGQLECLVHQLSATDLEQRNHQLCLGNLDGHDR